MILIGSLGSIGAGVSIPLMMFFFTNIIDNYTQAASYDCVIAAQIMANCSPIPLIPLINLTNQTYGYDLFGQVKENAVYLCSK